MPSWRGIPITLGTDGQYHAKVTVGHKPDGSLDRRHRSGRTWQEVRDKLRLLMTEVDAGRTPKVGRAPTVQEWFEQWLTTIAPAGRRKLAPRSLDDYWSKCRNWVFPNIGRYRLDALEPESLDQLYAVMREAKRAEGTIQKVHAIVRRGLAVALIRGKVTRNVALMVDPPGSAQPLRTPLAEDAARAVVEVARRRRNAARWLVGLSIGPRQGEALGLTWQHVDLDEGTVEIAWQLQRLKWRHGCTDPVACGFRPRKGRPRGVHRTRACPTKYRHGCADLASCKTFAHFCPAKVAVAGCNRHRRPAGCRPCPPGCAEHAAECPNRRDGGLVLRRPKTWRPERPIARVVSLHAHVVAALRERCAEQRAERFAAGTHWARLYFADGTEADLVFRQVDGKPIDPRQDWLEWRSILSAAGVQAARVHAMRHTTATMMLELGVDIAVVQEVLGHTDIRTTRGYQTVNKKLTRSAADKLGERLFGATVTDLVTERERRRSS